MQHQLGRVDLVHWQGRRLPAEDRAKSRVARMILGLVALSTVSLTIGFYSGLPVPLGVLRTLVVLSILSVGAYALRAGIDAVVHREERRVRAPRW
jgi:hypothetical protein